MTKPPLKTVRFEAGGKLVEFKAKAPPKPKPAITALFPVTPIPVHKVGVHAPKTVSKALKKAAASPNQKKFVIGAGDRPRVVVKGPPRQMTFGVPRGKMRVPTHKG